MKKFTYIMLLAAATLASCRKETPEIIIPDDQKEQIQFSASDAGGVMPTSNNLTKAGFTGITGGNSYSADVKTQIVARISSTDGSSTRHTRTLMTAQPDESATGGSNWNSTSSVNFSGNDYIRYWDDAFGRDAKLSVYAIAVPNKVGQINNSVSLENKLAKGSTNVNSVNVQWQKDEQNNVVSWTVTSAVTNDGVTTGQSSTTLENEDLCYSNNIQDGGKDGRFVWGAHGATGTYPSYLWQDHGNPCAQTHDSHEHDFYPNMDNGQMIFEQGATSDSPGHFDHGHMIFKHALTRITVDLVGGEGFDYNNAASFSLEPQTTKCPASVDLLKMITTNTLNIKTGVWTTPTDANKSAHTYMVCGSKATGTSFAETKTIYSLSAQVIPGYTVTNGSTENMMTFMIDGNNYYVTKDMIFDALNITANTTVNEADGSQKVTVDGSNITLEQGKNYHFSIKVSKTKIESLTCTLVDWVDVTGSFAATNAYISFNSLDAGEINDCQHFDLYRVLNLNNTVTDPTHTTFDGTSQYMTGYAEDSDPVRDSLSTDGTNPGITQKEAGTSTKSKIWETSWFFNNNKSFYHFRTVVPGTTITKEEASGKGDYFTMYSGPIMDTYPGSGLPEYPTEVIDGNATAKYNDYHWGAIFKPTTASPAYTANLNYDPETGFNSQLTGPVGPTTSTLNLIEQHMMSNIRVILLTPINDNGTFPVDAVDLYDASVGAPRKVSAVNITNFAGSATVRMGNGLITPATSYTTKSMTTPDSTTEWSGDSKLDPDTDYCTSKTFTFQGKSQKYYATQPYTYRIVPQSLTRGAGAANKVGITIQTPDDNMYYVVEDLSAVVPSSVTGNALKGDHPADGEGNYSAIDRWYPGYTYTYYFVISKSGIQALTCTIVDWVNVDAKGLDINLES